MKKAILIIIIVLQAAYSMAQGQLAFPFRGGKDAMTQFFNDSLAVSADIVQKRVVGTAFIKFTANTKGNISKIIVYYADDAILVTPAIDALRKSDRKWVISKDESTHDFIIPFVFSFNIPATSDAALQKTLYDNYSSRSPIKTTDQVPLDVATLLPPVVVNYDFQ